MPKRRLIDSVERKAKREKLVAQAMANFKEVRHWQRAIELTARNAKVSCTTVARALRISRRLSPAMLRMFDCGKIHVPHAEELARLAKSHQRHALVAILPPRPLTVVVDITRHRR